MFALGIFSVLNAAVSTYVFTQSTGTYTEISGGTVLGTTSSDDQRFVDPAVPAGGTSVYTGVGFPIGFNFTLDGNVFDRFAVNYNGWISLGQSALTPSVNITSSTNYPAPLNSSTVLSPTYLRTRIAGFAQDLQGQTGSELSYLTTGTSPNQVLVVQWKGVKRYGSSNTSNVNFQIRLYEGINKVETMYGGMTNNYTLTSWAAQAGIGGSVQADYTNRLSTTSWTATTAGTAATATIAYSSTIYPPSGLTFAWSVPSGPPILEVTPTSWNFNTVQINTTATKVFSISNTGGGTITLNSVIPNGLYYSVSVQPTDLVLSGGETTTFTVQYAPTAAGGPFTGNVVVDYTPGAKSTFSIDLTGSCLDPTINSFPHPEGFESGALPLGWTVTAAAATTYNWEIVTADAAHGAALPQEGTYFSRLYVYLATLVANPYSLVTPPIDLSSGDKQISYWAWLGADGSATPLDVEISTDNMVTWIPLYSHDLSTSSAWFNNVVSLAGYNSPNAFVRFKGTSNYGYNFCDMALDNIVIENIPATGIIIDVDGNTTSPGVTVVDGGTIPPELLGPDTNVPAVLYTVTATGVNDVTVYKPVQFTGDWYCWIKVGATLLAGGNPIPGATPNWVFTGVDFGAKGPITIVINDNATLPVELSSFTANLTAEYFVKLNWVSESETGLLGYRVYRSDVNDVTGSTMITPVMIEATNTSEQHSYTITDTEVESGNTYWYWLESVDYNHTTMHGPVSVEVVGNVTPPLPQTSVLGNAYPNPFKANTNIAVTVKENETATVTIYNILGQAVRTYTMNAGTHTINWDGRDSRNNACGSGIYFYKMSSPSLNQTKKMVIVK